MVGSEWLYEQSSKSCKSKRSNNLGGTYTVTATLSGCTSAAATTEVIINETPAQPTANSNSPLCSGNDLQLFSNTSTPLAVTYSWTGPNNFASANQNPVISNAAPDASGVYNVTATATQGNCQSLPGSINVVVNPTPAITSYSSINPATCSSATGSITFSGLLNSVLYTVNFKKNGTEQSANISTNQSGELVLSALTSGTYSEITVLLAGCSSKVFGPYTLTDPNPPATPVVTGNSPVCSGGTLQLSVTNSTSSTTYLWTGPDNFTSSLKDVVIANVPVTASGAYNITATVNNCTSSPATINVAVNPTPAMPSVTSNSPFCAGSTINLTAATAGSSITYAWTGPNGFTSNLQNPVIDNAVTAQNGTYSVTASAVNCPSSPAAVDVVIYPALTNQIDNSQKTICSSQTVAIAGETPVGGNANAYSFQWQQSTDNVIWTDLVGETGLSLTFSPAGNVYVRRKVTSGPCDSYSASAFIIVQPTVSNNVVRQDQSICINTIAAALTGSDATGGNGTYTYQWQQSADGGNTWTTIAGATARDYNPGILTTTTSYRRIASSNLCAGAQSNISPIVTVTIHPDAKALFLPPKDTACAPFHITDADINLQTFADRNSIYEWYADGAQIGRGVSFPGNVITNSEDSVTIKLVTVSKYGCKNDSMEHKFYTFIAPQPAFEASDTVGCGPLTVGFTNLTPKARLFIYHWDFGNGQTSALADPASVIFQPNPTYLDTTYKVKLTVFTQCDTITVFKNIHVKSKPKVLFTPDKTEGCSPMRVTFTNTSRGNNANYIWDFGDGTSPVVTNDATIQHTFTVGVRDTFYVKLKGTNECGADSLIYAIVVNPNSIRIDFAINGNERFGCAPHTVHFINNTTGATTFNWNFGDGSTLNTSKGIDTVVHTYTSPGNDTIKLFASNACNDTSDTELVTVALKPKVSFTANPLTACITETIHFANTSNSDIVSVWNFGDATTSSLRDPDKAYTSGGNYKVWLTGSRIYPEGTCRDSTYADVVIRDTIPGSFAVSDSAGNCTPFTVTFKNLNSPSRQTAWTFGDGATASGDSVTHTYTATGVYNVVMISHGSSGCIFKSVKSVSVTAPFGILIYKGGFFCKNQPIKFEIQATNTAEYKFVFGDGDSLTTTNPVVYHKYSQGGPFLPYAYLISGNCIKKIATGDTIKNENIKAGFSIIPNYNCGTTDIQFTDTSYAYSGLKLWQWNFGDGTSSSLQNPVKTFTQSGTSYVRFSISGQSGCRDTVTVPVSVIIRNIPVSNIRADSVACTSEALPVSALVFSQDSVVRYSWNFGDNATASGSHTIAVYNNTGTYTIRLTTTTIYGCSDTVYNKIIVNATPIVNAGGYVRICKGQSVQLQAFGAARWQWTPLQNLSCNTCANPVANPSLSTTYIVKGTTTFGCSATDTIAVNVVPPAKITISGDDTICIGQQTQLFASGAVDYAWSPAAGLSSASVANPVAKPATTTQYQVIGSDPYNCFADTAYVTVAVGNYPTVNLGTGGLVVAGTQVKMNPLFTNGPFLNYTWTPIDNLSCSSCPQPVATINTNVVYRLEVENVYGCKASDTISYTVKCEEAAQMFVPNAFSPDNDGLNDVLMVRGKGLAAVKYFRIFNRWGQLVFERNNFNANDVSQGWDGKVNGKPANPDVYVYTAEVICTAGGVFVKKGNVTLFR